MECDKPIRKLNRLQNYDYSTDGSYFITISSLKKQWIFCDVTNGITTLYEFGFEIEKTIQSMKKSYRNVNVDNYVIMPNHVHLLLTVRENINPIGKSATKNIPYIINSLKTITSKSLGFSVWHKSYHDHIVRNAKEYNYINNYINQNPYNWHKDCYYN
jgi:REP element-mobilizing transposase RayT